MLLYGKQFNPLDLTGLHADQNIDPSGLHTDQNMFCQEIFTYATGLHADHRVNGFVYIREPSSYYVTCFYLLHCKCGINWAQNTSKTDQKWRKSDQMASKEY